MRPFTDGEILKVIHEVEEVSNGAAGLTYDIPESCIRDWINRKEKLKNINKNKIAFSNGISTKFPQLGDQLFSYIQDSDRHGFAISTEETQL